MNYFITLLVLHTVLIFFTLWLACGKPATGARWFLRRLRNPFHREPNRRTYHRTLRLALMSRQLERWS